MYKLRIVNGGFFFFLYFSGICNEFDDGHENYCRTSNGFYVLASFYSCTSYRRGKVHTPITIFNVKIITYLIISKQCINYDN